MRNSREETQTRQRSVNLGRLKEMRGWYAAKNGNPGSLFKRYLAGSEPEALAPGALRALTLPARLFFSGVP